MEHNHDELNRTMGQILGEMKGVNQRLDTLNAKTNKNTNRINYLEAYKDQQIGKSTIVGGIAGAALGLIGAWASKLLGM